MTGAGEPSHALGSTTRVHSQGHQGLHGLSVIHIPFLELGIELRALCMLGL